MDQESGSSSGNSDRVETPVHSMDNPAASPTAPWIRQRHAQTRRGQIGLKPASFRMVLLLASLVAATAAADPVGQENAGPDDADLRLYLECSRIAEDRLLGLDEAAICSRVFLQIKLSFIPDMTVDEFDRLPPNEKTTVNNAGYLRYLEWSAEHPAKIDTLKNPPAAS